MPALELSGSRLRAREWRTGDGEEVWRLVQDQPNVFGRVGSIPSLEEAKRWVAEQLADNAAPERIKSVSEWHAAHGRVGAFTLST